MTKKSGTKSKDPHAHLRKLVKKVRELHGKVTVLAERAHGHALTLDGLLDTAERALSSEAATVPGASKRAGSSAGRTATATTAKRPRRSAPHPGTAPAAGRTSPAGAKRGTTSAAGRTSPAAAKRGTASAARRTTPAGAKRSTAPAAGRTSPAGAKRGTAAAGRARSTS